MKLNAQEIMALLDEVFPQVQGNFQIEDITPEQTTVRLLVQEKHLRPGGTVSGPSIFTLADCAMYIAVLAYIGREALAVTTNCSIDFMRKPPMGDLIAKARILKHGKVLMVGDVLIYADGDDAPVARANLTYSIPPKPSGV